MKYFFVILLCFALVQESVLGATSQAPTSAAKKPAAAIRGAASAAPAQGASQGMIIRGDQEAPLVLYIIPWQEARSRSLPDAPLVPIVPTALDNERSIVDDPLYRSLDPSSAKK